MQRLLIMLMALTMSVGAVTAAEAKQPTRTDRTVQGSYGPYPAPVTGCHSALGPFACLVVDTRPTERFFSARITDTHGQPVHVEVFSAGRRIAAFCGQTSTATAFPAGATLEFHVGLNNWLITPDCLTSRIKTTGSIRVRLSNRR